MNYGFEEVIMSSPTGLSLLCYGEPYVRVACSESLKDLLIDLYEHHQMYKPTIVEIEIGTSGSVSYKQPSRKELEEWIEISDIPEFMKEDLRDILL